MKWKRLICMAACPVIITSSTVGNSVKHLWLQYD